MASGTPVENGESKGNADRGAAFMNALAAQRNRALDDLAATAAELAVCRARVADLEAQLAELKKAGEQGKDGSKQP